MTVALISNMKNTYGFEDALQMTGFGKYNLAMLGSCCLLMLAMTVDIFGFSVLMPAVACDFQLSLSEQGLLSAVPLIGVMISSYAWGLCADTLGRRATLLVAMPLGMIFNFAASLAPNYWSLALLKFLSGSFTSSANAAAFVLLGESVPQRLRSRMIFLMVTTIMTTQLYISLFAVPIFTLSFRIDISWLSLDYRPWRLLMQVLCLPGFIGCLCIMLMSESPKYMLACGKETDTLHLLKMMYTLNTGLKKESFPVEEVFLDDVMVNTSNNGSFIRKMWNQTAPLFKPPLLVNSIKLYYILLCAYMVGTGFTMWVPTITNAYLNGEDVSGQTFCQVASRSGDTKNSTATDCDNTIEPMALYATMIYSAVCAILNIIFSFIVGPLGKKRTTNLVFVVSLTCGVLLLFVRIPFLSIGLFFMFLYVCLILGNINTYLVELNPTHLRGMATCLSVVVSRGFGFASVQLIGSFMSGYCMPMMSGYVLVIISGLVVSFFLPAETKKTTNSNAVKCTTLESTADINKDKL